MRRADREQSLLTGEVRAVFKVAREESRAVREWLGEVPKRKG